MSVRSWLHLFLSLLSLVQLTFCASASSSPQSQSIPAATKPSIPTTEPECLSRNGHWSQQGLGGGPYVCDLRANDAGKVCTDGAQCEGQCLVDNATEVGTRGVGDCSDYLVTYGCHKYLEQGVVHELCTD